MLFSSSAVKAVVMQPTFKKAYDLPNIKSMPHEAMLFDTVPQAHLLMTSTPEYEILIRAAEQSLQSDKLESSIEQAKANAWFSTHQVVLPIRQANGGTTNASPAASAPTNNQSSSASKRPSSGGQEGSNGDENGPPRKFRKTGKGGGGGSSTGTSPNKTYQKNPLLLNVFRTKSDDMVAIAEKNGGQPPFLNPTVTYIQNHQEWAKQNLMTTHVANRCDFANPRNYTYVTTEKGYKRYWTVMVNSIPEENIVHNTPTNRAAWCNQICNFHNNPTIAALYTWHDTMSFGADLTPQNASDYPYLSEYLTLDDTMGVIFDAYEGISFADILGTPDIFNVYFHPNHRPLAHAHFGFQAQLDNNGNNNDEPNIPGIQPFHF